MSAPEAGTPGEAGAPHEAGAVREPRAPLRIFVAVIPPPAVQTAAHAIGAALRSEDDRVSWVKPENLHYTLRFIGGVGDDGARRVTAAAAAAASSHAAFEVELGAPGAFPNPRRPRVLWVGLRAGAQAFVALARGLERELARRGFEKSAQPFRPHLTLGRVREHGLDWSTRLASAAGPAPALAFRVDRIAVVHSQLSPRG